MKKEGSGKKSPFRRNHRHEHKHEYGQSWSITAALLDGPKTFDELAEYFRIMARRFGIFVDLPDRKKDHDSNSTVNTAARPEGGDRSPSTYR